MRGVLGIEGSTCSEGDGRGLNVRGDEGSLGYKWDVSIRLWAIGLSLTKCWV